MDRSLKWMGVALACAVFTTFAAWGQSPAPAKGANAGAADLRKQLDASEREVARLKILTRELQTQNARLRAEMARRALPPGALHDLKLIPRLRAPMSDGQAVPPDWVPSGSGNTSHYLIPLEAEAHAAAPSALGAVPPARGVATPGVAVPASERAGRVATMVVTPVPRPAAAPAK